MSWFSDNVIETILVIGILLLIVEILVLGFGTFFLFFAGLAAVSTSALMWIGVIPETFIATLLSVAAFSAIYAALLWKKLNELQSDVDNTHASSDLVGHSFILTEDVKSGLPQHERATYEFSGIEWRLDAQQDLPTGTLVEVIQADVGKLIIKAK